MDPMSEYLARAIIEGRLALAIQEGSTEVDPDLGRGEPRRKGTGRRRTSRLVSQRWWRRRIPPGFDIGTLALAAAAPDRLPSTELARVLEEAAHRIAEQGTAADHHLLTAMSEVASASAPGAAAALVDPDGSETSRLRAFGILHAHFLTRLGPREQGSLLDLLDLLDREGQLERPRRAA